MHHNVTEASYAEKAVFQKRSGLYLKSLFLDNNGHSLFMSMGECMAQLCVKGSTLYYVIANFLMILVGTSKP